MSNDGWMATAGGERIEGEERLGGALGGAGEIEFLDVSAGRSDATVEAITAEDQTLLRWWPLAVAALLGVWLVSSTGSSDEPITAPDLTPSLTVAPISPMLRSDLDFGDPYANGPNPGAPDPWPVPPQNRDPYVVRIPGPQELPFAGTESTLVYINTLGDPTVVSLETGDVFEIDVAAIRVHETFAVEDGEVRSLEGANPGLEDATANAVVFHTYRDVDPPGVGAVGGERGIGRGPELCLSETSCRRVGQGLDTVEMGGILTERLDAQRHAGVMALLNSFEEVDRWIAAPDGYRIPIPVGQIWIMTAANSGGVDAGLAESPIDDS